jgi:hypothetical protein
MTVVTYLLSPRMACMLSIPFNVDFQLYALCFCVVLCHFNHTLLSIIHLWREWASIKLEAWSGFWWYCSQLSAKYMGIIFCGSVHVILSRLWALSSHQDVLHVLTNVETGTSSLQIIFQSVWRSMPFIRMTNLSSYMEVLSSCWLIFYFSAALEGLWTLLHESWSGTLLHVVSKS